jgi:hypothetical protein
LSNKKLIMKKTISILVMLLMTVSLAFAQGNGKPKKTPEQRADAYANKMQKDLGLDATQRTKVRDLALARAKKMDELREQYKGQDKKVWQAERKKARDEFHNGMKSTLSPEQYTKWQEQRAKQAANKAKAKGKGKPKKGKGGKPGTTEPAPTGGDADEPDQDPDLDGE